MRDIISLAMDPNTPPGVLAALSHTSCAVLAFLSQDGSVDVRWEIAQNPNTPPQSLTALGQDPDWSVQKHVLRNPSTPQGIWVASCRILP